MKKKLMAAVLAGAMLLSATACGAKETATEAETSSVVQNETETTTSGETYRIAMVTDSGDITDQSFNQTTYEACKAFAEENGVDFNYYKPGGDSDADHHRASGLSVRSYLKRRIPGLSGCEICGARYV